MTPGDLGQAHAPPRCGLRLGASPQYHGRALGRSGEAALNDGADKGSRQRLAAILAADAAGYSRLMAQDEAATMAALDAARAAFRSEI